MRYLYIILLPVLLFGCFGIEPRTPSVQFVEIDNVPMRMVSRELVDVKYVENDKENTKQKNLAGYFILHPKLYAKLLKAATSPQKGGTKVIVVESDDITYKITSDKEFDLVHLDTTGNQNEFKCKIQGYFALSPSLYSKLLNTGLDKNK